MTNSKYRVIFLGPTGSGKTSAVRTLLKVANSKDTNSANIADAAQRTYQLHTEVILDKQITVVDTPGLVNIQDEANIELELHSAFHATLPGPHVIVLVFSIETSHDIIRQTCNRYHERLGETVMKHTAVLFTGVDILESDGRNFHGYIDTLPSDIKQLIGKQYVAFNNNANAPLINVLQVRELMAMIDQIYTRSFGLYYKVKQTATPKANFANVFEKNSETLEKNLSEHKDASQNRLARDTTDTNTESHETNTKPDSLSEGLLVQNGETDDASGSRLSQDSVQGEHDIQENVLLQSIPPHSEAVSKDSDDASMISSNQSKDGSTCGCFSSISRKFRSSNKEPGFTQFN